ncbi:MAG: 1-deoxy-D-xylulose-5-phosphate reductoisomerase [Planctomycetota bacterium]|nr:1-deoxy-D-xylulose-5-phosphate reductoisomerase [Planctomycetota bacterium]
MAQTRSTASAWESQWPSSIILHVKKRVAIIGSTGSIGCSTLDVIKHLGPPYKATALGAHRQVEKLAQQAITCGATAVAITDESRASDLKRLLGSAGPEVYAGENAQVDLVERDDVDIVVAAVVGAAGLPVALASVRAGKTLALANKESLVVAGSLLIPEARRLGVPLLPVDSEHSAIFQAMRCGRVCDIRRVILTASGGPFRDASPQKIRDATLADALNHPTWRMGNKITIDSATMFNKVLEFIEACWLFDLKPEDVQIVIHPESVIHSMVEFVDGSVIAQLSPPDMRTPIQYALTYPERADGCGKRMDWAKPFTLNFQPPDFDRFPALRLAEEVARAGGTMGAVLNAANEVAVAAFIAGNIRFGDIYGAVEHTIDAHRLQEEPTLDDLLEADRWAREAANAVILKHSSHISI